MNVAVSISLLRSVTCLVLIGFAASLHAATESPFVPAKSDTPTSEAAPGYQLVGMTAIGRETLLSIAREPDQSGVWIAVGKKVGDIEVLRYDEKSERAVIRTGGKEQSLTLRKAPPPSTDAPNPSPFPPPAAPAAPSVGAITEPVKAVAPNSPQQEKEMEARMLVTDLLEIGQEHRKAYEEAQRKATSTQAAARPASPPPTSAPPPADKK